MAPVPTHYTHITQIDFRHITINPKHKTAERKDR
jgi:hypothetical protein